MVKSTPINQLPNNTQSQLENRTMNDAGYIEEYANNQKAQEKFKHPIDTTANLNIDDDISINEVMSELNSNQHVESNEASRLQEQIFMLQTEIENQKRQNDSVLQNNQNHMFVPQAPSAHIINQEHLNNIKIQQSNNVVNELNGEAIPPTVNSKNGGWISNLTTWFNIGTIYRFLDLRLFLVVFVVCAVVFSTFVDSFVMKYLKDSKYNFLKEHMKAFFVALIVIVSSKI